jgi:hypothetical protein
MASTIQRSRVFGYFSLFTSFGTLICCALPSLLVLLGLGVTVASFLSAAPWLVTLSRHKTWVFAISGALIVGNFWYVYRLAPAVRVQREACLPDSPEACASADRISRAALWISAIMYAVGFFTAFVLGRILTALD